MTVMGRRRPSCGRCSTDLVADASEAGDAESDADAGARACSDDGFVTVLVGTGRPADGGYGQGVAGHLDGEEYPSAGRQRMECTQTDAVRLRFGERADRHLDRHDDRPPHGTERALRRSFSPQSSISWAMKVFPSIRYGLEPDGHLAGEGTTELPLQYERLQLLKTGAA